MFTPLLLSTQGLHKGRMTDSAWLSWSVNLVARLSAPSLLHLDLLNLRAVGNVGVVAFPPFPCPIFLPAVCEILPTVALLPSVLLHPHISYPPEQAAIVCFPQILFPYPALLLQQQPSCPPLHEGKAPSCRIGRYPTTRYESEKIAHP